MFTGNICIICEDTRYEIFRIFLLAKFNYMSRQNHFKFTTQNLILKLIVLVKNVIFRTLYTRQKDESAG